eukprot:Hpha_TRINITY_DN14930_c0_g1::TRINITY_DN14930_c0_g1_i1::g.143288::m.143288
MSLAAEIRELKSLFDAGVLDATQFERSKNSVVAKHEAAAARARANAGGAPPPRAMPVPVRVPLSSSAEAAGRGVSREGATESRSKRPAESAAAPDAKRRRSPPPAPTAATASVVGPAPRHRASAGRGGPRKTASRAPPPAPAAPKACDGLPRAGIGGAIVSISDKRLVGVVSSHTKRQWLLHPAGAVDKAAEGESWVWQHRQGYKPVKPAEPDAAFATPAGLAAIHRKAAKMVGSSGNREEREAAGTALRQVASGILYLAAWPGAAAPAETAMALLLLGQLLTTRPYLVPPPELPPAIDALLAQHPSEEVHAIGYNVLVAHYEGFDPELAKKGKEKKEVKPQGLPPEQVEAERDSWQARCPRCQTRSHPLAECPKPAVVLVGGDSHARGISRSVLQVLIREAGLRDKYQLECASVPGGSAESLGQPQSELREAIAAKCKEVDFCDVLILTVGAHDLDNALLRAEEAGKWRYQENLHAAARALSVYLVEGIDWTKTRMVAVLAVHPPAVVKPEPFAQFIKKEGEKRKRKVPFGADSLPSIRDRTTEAYNINVAFESVVAQLNATAPTRRLEFIGGVFSAITDSQQGVVRNKFRRQNDSDPFLDFLALRPLYGDALRSIKGLRLPFLSSGKRVGGASSVGLPGAGEEVCTNCSRGGPLEESRWVTPLPGGGVQAHLGRLCFACYNRLVLGNTDEGGGDATGDVEMAAPGSPKKVRGGGRGTKPASKPAPKVSGRGAASRPAAKPPAAGRGTKPR